MIAIASAPPSTGSVPAPASSSSTSAGSVERLRPSRRCWRCGRRTCSGSPRSTARRRCRRTRVLEHRDLRAVRRRDQQPRLRHQRQQAGRLERHGLAAGVRPVMTSTRDRRNQQDVHRHRLTAPCRPAARRRSAGSSTRRRGDAAAPGSAADAARRAARAGRPRRSRARTPSTSIEKRARACRTSSSVAASTVRSDRRARRRNASVSASRMRRTSSASCCSSATMSLLISTVLSGSRNRLAPLPELPCTMPGIDAAMLGADDQHVAAVAVGDDLLLEILRGVLAAQVRLERAAQPRPLLAQPIADAPQLRARIVDDLAAGIDLAADVGDLAIRSDAAVSAIARRTGKAPRARRTDGAGGFDRSEEVGEREQLARLERRGLRPRAIRASTRGPRGRGARSGSPPGSGRFRPSRPARGRHARAARSAARAARAAPARRRLREAA